MRSFILVIIAIILVSSAYGAQNAKITVDKEGSYYYWFTYSDIKGKPVTTTPVGFTDKKATIELPLVKDAVPKCVLFILNETTGNEAVLLVNTTSGKPIKFDLKAAGFDKVRRVEVLVTSAGKPAAAAIVRLDLGDKKEHLQVLDPSAQGIVQFTDVPSGTTKVSVEYGDGKTASQDVDVPLERDDRIPRVEIPIVGQIDTVNAPGAAKADGEATAPVKEPVNTTVNLPTAIVGLLFLGLIVYGATKLMGKRGAGFRQVMKRVGVNLPGEPEPESVPLQSTSAAPVDPTICPFCGGKKDPATGACACTVGAGAAASAPIAGSGPRLIATQGAYAGAIYQLDGTMIAGRDESNPIAFPQDTTVSRKHARIVSAGGTVTITDEGSSNGTFVNGVKITEQALNPGDEVQIGNTRLRYEI